MSYQQQQMGCSDPRSASGFSLVYTSFQQRWGEREKASQMGYASAQGHTPYLADSLGQPLSGCSPQYGYMFYTTDRQHPSRCWSHAPSQQGVYMPEYHQPVQTKSPAPLLPAVKMESDLKQPFQFQAMVEGNCPRVLSCSADNPAFDFRFHTKDSYNRVQAGPEF